MTDERFEQLCNELLAWQAAEKEAAAAAEAVKDQLKAELGTAQAFSTACFDVSWTPVKSSRLDAVALRRSLPQVAALFTKSVEYRRLLVAKRL